MIDLTPLDIRKKKGDFNRGLRGYDPQAVDGFLDLVAERVEELVRENLTLRERAAQLSETVEGYRERERALNDALVTAQQMREEIRSQAAREAELTVQQARADADRILAEAREQTASAREELRRLEASRMRFVRGFRAFVERQLSDLEQEEEQALRESVEEA